MCLRLQNYPWYSLPTTVYYKPEGQYVVPPTEMARVVFLFFPSFFSGGVGVFLFVLLSFLAFYFPANARTRSSLLAACVQLPYSRSTMSSPKKAGLDSTTPLSDNVPALVSEDGKMSPFSGLCCLPKGA